MSSAKYTIGEYDKLLKEYHDILNRKLDDIQQELREEMEDRYYYLIDCAKGLIAQGVDEKMVKKKFSKLIKHCEDIGDFTDLESVFD